MRGPLPWGMDKSNPCYKCEERHLKCHDACEKYAAWKAERQKRKEEELGDKQMNRLMHDNAAKRFKDIKAGHRGKGLNHK